MAKRTIVTNYIKPPIPVRQFDWCAHYDGEEEAGNYGYGATEVEAIRDFKDNYAEDHDARLDAKSPNPFLQGEWEAHVGWADKSLNLNYEQHPNWCEITGPNGLSINGHFGIEVARVIAAAPNALEALRGLDAYWTADFPEGPDGTRVALGGFGEVSNDTMQIWRIVRAAIAKAEGK